ncbi:helix-turn-helix domain-containing protein [Streptacidiphilus monticola]|uniref:Helix-turn-helix domain-containing protein n=1 Tax=Streptacidiphilus monticola TaxID=2161674 RepID=A0ABW1FUN8_9ACTN
MGDANFDARLAARLTRLRAGHEWSLDQLAERTGASRSTLSRLERGEISPTASLLGRLCAAYGITMSWLLAEVEAEPPQLLPASEQPVWRDDASGFVRRQVSPPLPTLRGELIEARLAPGADIAYTEPAVRGLEQHIWLLEGQLEITANDRTSLLRPGDCLRFRLWGSSRFRVPGDAEARYVLAVVLP